MIDSALTGYVDGVHAIVGDVTGVIRAARELLEYRGLPDDQFAAEAARLVLPLWPALCAWESHHRQPAGVAPRAVPVVPELVTLCTAELDPIDVWDFTCRTAGEAAQVLAKQLLSELSPLTFDDTDRQDIQACRRKLDELLTATAAVAKATWDRAPVEAAKVRLGFMLGTNQPADQLAEQQQPRPPTGDPLAQAIAEWEAINARLNALRDRPTPLLSNPFRPAWDVYSREEQTAIREAMGSWKARWYDRRPFDLVALYFHAQERRDEIMDRLHGTPPPDSTCDLGYFSEWVREADRLDVIDRPLLPAEPLTFGKLAQWLDGLTTAVRRHSAKSATAVVPPAVILPTGSREAGPPPTATDGVADRFKAALAQRNAAASANPRMAGDLNALHRWLVEHQGLTTSLDTWKRYIRQAE